MSGKGKADLKDEIQQLIKDNKVMVFSATYCKLKTELTRLLRMIFLKVHIAPKRRKFLVNINSIVIKWLKSIKSPAEMIMSKFSGK